MPFNDQVLQPQQIEQAPVPTDPGLFDGQLQGAPDPLAIETPDAPQVAATPNEQPQPEQAVPNVDPALIEPYVPDAEDEQILEQQAGAGSIINNLMKRKPTYQPGRLKNSIEEDGTAGIEGNYAIIREASPDEIAEFNKLTGQVHGVPSPTPNQILDGMPVAEFNLEQINGPDDLKLVISKISRMWTEAGRRAGRDVQTNEATEELARKMGYSDVVNRLLRRKPGDTMNAEQIRASLQAIATSAMELNRLAKVAANSTDAEVLLRFRQHMGFHAALQIQMKGAQMEAARALQVFNMPRDAGGAIDAERLTTMLNEYGGDSSVRELAQAYLDLPNQAARNKFSSGVWDKARGTWFEVWINGLLSSWNTHMANINGNMVFSFIHLPEKFIAGLVGQARHALGSETDRVYMGEAVAELVAMPEAIADGFRLAAEAWRTEAPVRDIVSKVEASQRRMITGQNFMPDSPGWMQKGIDYLGATIRVPGRALMAEDEFFKGVAYRRELRALAYRRTMKMKDEGATDEQISLAMDDLFAGKLDDINNSAEDTAAYSTFTNPVKGFLGELGAAFQRTTVGRFLFPFYRTPVDITKAMMERSPFGFINVLRKHMDGDPIARDLAFARASLGTGIMLTTGYWAMQGRITGSGPSDPTLRSQLENLGWKRWSFVTLKDGVENPRWLQVGHTMVLHPEDVNYVSYHKLEPISMILAIAADTGHRLRWPTAEDADRDEITNAILGGIDAMWDYLKDQSFLTGFGNVAEIVGARSLEEQIARVERFTQQLIGSQMPFSSAIGSIERANDPTLPSVIEDRDLPIGIKTIYAGLQKWTDRMGYNGDRPLLRDRFYLPRISKNHRVLDMILPPWMADVLGDDSKKIAVDPVMKEVVAAGVPLRMPEKTIEGVSLTAKEYDTFLKFASFPPPIKQGRMVSKIPSFYDQLKDVFALEFYKQANAAQKQTMIKAADADSKSTARDMMLEMTGIVTIDGKEVRLEDYFAELRTKVRANKQLRDEVGRQIE